jgi:hypothetical protein
MAKRSRGQMRLEIQKTTDADNQYALSGERATGTSSGLARLNAESQVA